MVCSASSVARAKRVCIWRWTSSCEQPQIESCAWFCSSVRHAACSDGRSSGVPSARPSAAHGSAHPSSACSRPAVRAASGRVAPTTRREGGWRCGAPSSSPRNSCAARRVDRVDEIVEETARRRRVPCVAASASATAAVWSSGSMWSMPFMSSAGARSIGPRRSEHAEQAVDRRRPVSRGSTAAAK